MPIFLKPYYTKYIMTKEAYISSFPFGFDIPETMRGELTKEVESALECKSVGLGMGKLARWITSKTRHNWDFDSFKKNPELAKAHDRWHDWFYISVLDWRGRFWDLYTSVHYANRRSKKYM